MARALAPPPSGDDPEIVYPRALGILGVVAASTLLLAANPTRAAFSNATAAYGLELSNQVSYAASFVDYDGDGDHDLYVCDHWRASHLYRNDGGPVYGEQSGHYGTGNIDRHDALWGDFDNDGAPDQYIVRCGDCANELFWNLGNGVFEEGAAAAGVEDFGGRGREITLADFDQDGNLDIYVANVVWAVIASDPNVLFWNQGDGTFVRESTADSLFNTRLHCSSADYDADGFPDILVTHPTIEAGELFRNDGDGTWTDVTAVAFPGPDSPLRRAQGISWADYDDDGDLDLLAAWGDRGVYDFAVEEAESLRFHTETSSGEVKRLSVFTDGDSVTVFAQRENFVFPVCWYGGGGDSVGVFPATFAMTDLVGEPPAFSEDRRGVFLWAESSPPWTLLRFAMKASSTQSLKVGGDLRPNGTGILSWSKIGFDAPPTHYGDHANRLLRNEGDGTFADVTATALSTNDSNANSMGAAWADYDNDGRIDVYVSNGGTFESGNQPNQLYRNNGDGTFTEVAAIEGVQGSSIGQSDGAAWGDVNGDGFFDLFLYHGEQFPPFGSGPRELFLNTPNGNHWIEIRPRGLASNGSGIGTRVRFVTASGTRERTLLGESDDGYAAFLGIHAGLGADTVCDTVQVFWPSGQVDTHLTVAADQRYFAVEGEPLRELGNPLLTINPDLIWDTLHLDEIASYAINLGNNGGAAVDFTVTLEDCAGQPAPWLSVDRAAGAVWPGGSPYGVTLTVDATGFPPGAHCGRAIFSSNSLSSPDTVRTVIRVPNPTQAASLPTVPERFDLQRRGRNPLLAESGFRLVLPAAAAVEVAIFDVRGRRVRTLLSEDRPAGYHHVHWDGLDEAGRRPAPGVYFVRAAAGGDQVTRKLIVASLR